MLGAWSFANGVGTAMTNTSAGSIWSEARNDPRATTPDTSPSRSTSSICTLPELTVSTTEGVTSTPRTLAPVRAITAAVGRPI